MTAAASPPPPPPPPPPLRAQALNWIDLQNSDLICAASVGKLQCPQPDARLALGIGQCSQQSSASGCLRSSWRSAFHACTMVGARLCRATELQDNEASGTGCGFGPGLRVCTTIQLLSVGAGAGEGKG